MQKTTQQNLFAENQITPIPYTENDKRIRVLTLWQPYATLFLHRKKEYETRPKPTSHNGIYLIHAAKQIKKESKLLCEEESFKTALASLGYNHWSELPKGCIIGEYRQKECIEVQYSYQGYDSFDGEDAFVIEGYNYEGHENILYSTPNEEYFGDFSKGRWVWTGKNFRELENPLPYSNGQGYYRVFQGNYSKLQFKQNKNG